MATIIDSTATATVKQTYYERNKERIMERIASLSLEQKAEIKERKAEWYAKNRESELKKSTAYAAAHKEHIKELKADWYLEQKKTLTDEAKAAQKEYQRVYRLKQKEARDIKKSSLHVKTINTIPIRL